MPWKIRTAICKQCGGKFTGRFSPNRDLCGVPCRQLWLNDPERNPAKRPDVRRKLSVAAKGNKWSVGRTVSKETRDKISQSLSGRELSTEHRAAISRGVRKAGCRPPLNTHLVGPNHPNWIDGSSTIRQTQFHNPRYRTWRKAVLDRDGWACQDCGHKGSSLHAHHLKPWGPYPALRYEVSNGVTLCSKCHHDRHRGQPRPITSGPRTLAEKHRESPTSEALP